MDSTTPYRSTNRSRTAVVVTLILWLALIAVTMISIAQTGFIALRLLSVPTPHYEYCTKEWRQQQLPLDMQAQFTDWCEHRSGR